MANKFYEEENIRSIAEAIREKNGTVNTYTVAQMADAIRDLNTGSSDGGVTPTGTITITENGTHDVTNYASAVVNVAGGGEVSIGNWHTGTFMIETDETGDTVHTVTHNLGFIPTYIIVWANEYNDLTKYSGKATIGGHKLGNNQGHIRKTNDDTTVSYSSAALINNVTETSFDFGGVGATYIRPAGWTYRWFALP